MLSNIDFEGLGKSYEEKKCEIEEISIGIQNAIRSGQGLPPLSRSWECSTGFASFDFQKLAIYGVAAYFGFKVFETYMKNRR